MIETNSNLPHTPDAMRFGNAVDDDGIDLIDLMIVMAKHKKLIIGLPLAAVLTAAAISLAIPNVYTGETKLLPPQQAQSGAAALLSQLGGAAGMVAGVAGIKSAGDLYVGMLKSRTVTDMLIAEHQLVKVYEVPSVDRARVRLQANTDISAGKDGLITIKVEDRDQKLVAPLANSYAAALTKLTRTLALTEASQRRLFFEQQLETSKNNLAKAEVALKRAIDTSGVISVDVDSRSVLGTIGQLRAHISAKEIQINSMRSFVTTSNPDFQRVQEELNSLRAELSKLENGRPQAVGAGALPQKQAGLENIKILREVKYHQMLYELLAKQYEFARLEEAKQPSLIQVLDTAIEPERKSKPKRAVIVLFTGVLSLLAALGIAFAIEARQQALLSPHMASKWDELRAHLRLRKKK
ncbi:GumC family protein [Massilia sp. GCM10023247]|uniref:GumC family protein n=1 Tax=Massilia sp. GCM10023247 TaxID=3252643 RepID=UPI00361BECDE